jgi:HK97 gp10 family phage protein
MEVQVKGLDKLLKKLDKLGGSIPQSTQKALLKGGAVFEKALKQDPTPKDTGLLRESMHTEAKDANTVSVGTNVDYAAYVEFGTGLRGDPSVSHTTKRYWKHKDGSGEWHVFHGQPPQPFMRTAFAENKDKVVDAVKESIREDVKNLK